MPTYQRVIGAQAPVTLMEAFTPAGAVTDTELTLGQEFYVDVAGTLTAVGVYADAALSYTVGVWSTSGVLLASATATAPGTGWFDVPLTAVLTAGQHFIVGYNAPAGRPIHRTTAALGAGQFYDNGPLHSGSSGGGNGRYLYGGGGLTYPSNTFDTWYGTSAVFTAGFANTARFLATSTRSIPATVPLAPIEDRFFPSQPTPTDLQTTDTNPVELGMMFNLKSGITSGFIAAVAFYKASTTTADYTASLYHYSSGAWGLRARKTLSVAGQGWQRIDFDTPAAIVGGESAWAVAFWSSEGFYGIQAHLYDSPGIPDSAYMDAYYDGESGAQNGWYEYKTSLSSTISPASFNSTNYFVDPIFHAVAGVTERSIPCTVQLSYTAQRTVPATVLLSRVAQRSIPFTVLFSRVAQRTIPATAQLSRVNAPPVADITTSGWTNASGSPATYAALLNPNDVDYVQSPDTPSGTSATMIVRMAPMSDPGDVLQIALRPRTFGPLLKVDLLDASGVQVATRTLVPPGTFGTLALVLTTAEIAAYRAGNGFTSGGQVRIAAVAS